MNVSWLERNDTWEPVWLPCQLEGGVSGSLDMYPLTPVVAVCDNVSDAVFNLSVMMRVSGASPSQVFGFNKLCFQQEACDDF